MLLTELAALSAIHFQVGNLILVDALPSKFVFIDQSFSPYDLRLCACRSIVNALNLALQTPYSKTNGWPGSHTLLLDPHPDHMTNAMIRTGSSLCILYTMQKLTQENVNAMFAVVIAALKVLSEVSHIASEAIPLLEQKLAQSGIHQAACLGDDTARHASISKPSLVDFDAEAVRELEQLAQDPFLVDLLVAGSDDSSGSDYLQYEMEPSDLDILLPDWISEVCVRIPIENRALSVYRTTYAVFPRNPCNVSCLTYGRWQGLLRQARVRKPDHRYPADRHRGNMGRQLRDQWSRSCTLDVLYRLRSSDARVGFKAVDSGFGMNCTPADEINTVEQVP